MKTSKQIIREQLGEYVSVEKTTPKENPCEFCMFGGECEETAYQICLTILEDKEYFVNTND